MSSLLQQSQNKQSFLPSHAPRLSSKLNVVEWKRNFSFPNSLFPMPSLFTSIPDLPKCLILKGLLKSLRIWRYNCKVPLCLPEDGKYSHLCRNEWQTSSSHDQILIKCKSPGQKSHISFLFAGYLSQTRTLLRVHRHNLCTWLFQFCLTSEKSFCSSTDILISPTWPSVRN